jgi:hypothetical protein
VFYSAIDSCIVSKKKSMDTLSGVVFSDLGASVITHWDPLLTRKLQVQSVDSLYCVQRVSLMSSLSLSVSL